jgi:hypothetical protein
MLRGASPVISNIGLTPNIAVEAIIMTSTGTRELTVSKPGRAEKGARV